MFIFLVLLITGCLVGALPTAKLLYSIIGRRDWRLNWRHIYELQAAPVRAQVASEAITAFVALGLNYAVAGGRLGLVSMGIGLVIGTVWVHSSEPRPAFVRGSIAGATVLLLLNPQLFLSACIIWGAAYILFRSTTAATIVSAFSIPLSALYWQYADIFVVYSTITAGLIGYRRLVFTGILGKRLRLGARVLIYVFVIVALLVLAYGNRYVYRGFGPAQDIMRRGPSSLPVIALTFDDGPHPVFTPMILDILAEYDVRATFFMVGKHVEMYPEIARRVVEEGHEVGNHSYSHPNMWRMTQPMVKDEINSASSIIYDVTGRFPYAFRPPRGLYNDVVLEHLASIRQPMVLWSVSSQDWAEVSDRNIVNRVLSSTGNGDILLFHDSGDLFGREGGNRMNTVRALPVIIEQLQQQGYYFLTVTEMMIVAGLVEDSGN